MLNIYQIVSNKQWSGAEQYAFDLMATMRDDPDEKYYLEIVTQNRPQIIGQFRRLEVPVSTLPLKGLSDLDTPVRLARMIRRGRNILHVHSMKDAVTAVMARKISENASNRIVLTCHSVERPKTSFLYRRILKELDHIVFVSQISYDEFISHAHRFDRARASVIHDSIRPIQPAGPVPSLRQLCGIGHDTTLILFHGRVCKDKGVDVLLRALSQLHKHDFHLAIIGNADRKYLRHLRLFIQANQLADNITFLGFQSDLQPLIAQCDFGVLPATWREPFGISNLEYMMQGKAHIATNNGGQMEYLRPGENALVVAPDDFPSLSAAIQQLISDNALRQRLGRQAQADFSQSLDYPHFYRQITALYHTLW